MSIISLSSDDPTVTVDGLRTAAAANNISIEPNSANESTFLRFANSFDAVCASIDALPVFEHPQTVPCEVEAGRQYHRPSPEDNPLNAWAYRTNLRSPNRDAANGPLAGRTIAIKDNMSVGGLPLGLGTSASLFNRGGSNILQADLPGSASSLHTMHTAFSVSAKLVRTGTQLQVTTQ